jgi:hypothetical protein
METEKKEYWIDGKCRYKLAILEWCRSCLFSTLCHLEMSKDNLKKEKKSDLSINDND